MNSSNKPSKNSSSSSGSKSATDEEDNRKHVLILGDSIVKHFEGWRISRSTKTRSSVKSFPGATISDCYEYFKPTLNSNPDEIVIHIGTNDLKTKSARNTAEGIIDLAKWVESSLPATKISISELTLRNDQEELRNKVTETNKMLMKFCNQHDWLLINHLNIDESCLNRSKLHLNKKGTGRFSSNLIRYISN